MARIDAHLIRKGARVLNARKGRLLDLRGNRIAEIENLGATEDQFDMINLSDNEIVKLENFPHMNRLGTLLIKNNMITHINPTLGEFLPKIHTLVLTKNCLTTLAEIDPLASLPSLKVLSLLDNTVTKLTDYRLYVVHTLKHLTLLDFMKVKREERIAATNKFHSKESYEEVKKSGAKAYCPVHVGDTQYTIKEHGPKVVSPTSERIMAIKAAIVNSETLNEVARIKGVKCRVVYLRHFV
uniref:Uncharacterized protein n=1 Tax=Avena sativa TaxID=4498 RepID=A0ACD5X431_AVESA